MRAASPRTPSAIIRSSGARSGSTANTGRLAGAVYAVLSSAVIPALPSLQHTLHASETGVTWLLTGPWET